MVTDAMALKKKKKRYLRCSCFFVSVSPGSSRTLSKYIMQALLIFQAKVPSSFLDVRDESQQPKEFVYVVLPTIRINTQGYIRRNSTVLPNSFTKRNGPGSAQVYSKEEKYMNSHKKTQEKSICINVCFIYTRIYSLGVKTQKESKSVNVCVCVHMHSIPPNVFSSL